MDATRTQLRAFYMTQRNHGMLVMPCVYPLPLLRVVLGDTVAFIPDDVTDQSAIVTAMLDIVQTIKRSRLRDSRIDGELLRFRTTDAVGNVYPPELRQQRNKWPEWSPRPAANVNPVVYVVARVSQPTLGDMLAAVRSAAPVYGICQYALLRGVSTEMDKLRDKHERIFDENSQDDDLWLFKSAVLQFRQFPEMPEDGNDLQDEPVPESHIRFPFEHFDVVTKVSGIDLDPEASRRECKPVREVISNLVTTHEQLAAFVSGLPPLTREIASRVIANM